MCDARRVEELEGAVVALANALGEAARQHRVTSAAARRAARAAWEAREDILSSFPHLQSRVTSLKDRATHDYSNPD